MSSVNKAILLGRVGQDPESKKVGEHTLSTFSLATSEKYKDKETTEWHNVKVWGKLADVANQYIKKGDLLYVEGKIETEKWETKEGEKRSRSTIKATNFTMLGGNKQAAPQSNTQPIAAPTSTDNDLPF